jgi:hypothetical protein
MGVAELHPSVRERPVCESRRPSGTTGKAHGHRVPSFHEERVLLSVVGKDRGGRRGFGPADESERSNDEVAGIAESWAEVRLGSHGAVQDHAPWMRPRPERCSVGAGRWRRADSRSLSRRFPRYLVGLGANRAANEKHDEPGQKETRRHSEPLQRLTPGGSLPFPLDGNGWPKWGALRAGDG